MILIKKESRILLFLNSFLKLIAILFTLSCSSKLVSGLKNAKPKKEKFIFVDPTGKFSVLRRSGINSSKDFVTKEELFPHTKWEQPVLEKGIMISSYSKYNKKVSILIPKISQRTFWFDKKKYFTESKFFTEKKEVKFSWRSPSDLKLKKKVIKIDSEGKLYCFFGQLIDCIKETGFFKTSKLKKNGVVYFSVIFDGYPFFNEQFGIFKSGPIIESDFSFEKEMENGVLRYALSFLDQKITYFVDRKGNLIDKFWISQGLSLKKI
ncbi:MAG: hypothetical protein CME68_01290 [Halobacteriovoraceae bacterium]|nr:hypothetical protein [Halobacteriovoraceae bacterium]